MAQKVRVFKLASEFGYQNDEMVSKIQKFGFVVRNYMSGLNEDEAVQVRQRLQKEREANTVEEKIRPTVVRRRVKAVAAPKPIAKIVEPVSEKPQKTASTTKPVKAKKRASVKKAAPVEETVQTSVEEMEKVAKSVESNMEATVASEDVNPPAKEQSVEIPLDEAANQLEKEFMEKSQDSESSILDNIDNPPAEVQTLEEQEAAQLRPASEAPLVRRRIQTSGNTSAKGASRRRKVESREMIPARASQKPSGRGNPATSSAPSPIKGRKRKMAPGKKGKKTQITTPKAIKRLIKIEGQVTLQELAKRMSIKSTELLMKLMSMGMANININSSLDVDTSKIIAEEFGYEVENVEIVEDDLLAKTRSGETDEEKSQRIKRAPVVTMMGHVDHGKTSLLDYIRKAHVADGEAGGITQHVGAYRVKTEIGEIAFIDTPGHAAFTAMRSRGAEATDIVVVVCAADDGVMPQTMESIDHATVAKCPIIVAINKCDLPGANVEKTRRELMERGLVPEELGGETIIIEVSAKTGQGVEQLLEMISLQAEVMELDANPNRSAVGVVLEAYLDKGRGPVANVLVQEGVLSVNNIVVTGQAFGKVRAMTNEKGQKVTSAGSSTPVEILGLSAVPAAGDTFDVVEDMKLAEKVASRREDKERAIAAAASRPSLDALYLKMQNGDQEELKVMVKSDVRGTMEAIKDALIKLSNEKVKVTVIGASVGGITESDVLLASTANAIIVGFNVRPTGKARKLADQQNIEIRLYSVIYEILDSIEGAMQGLLAPTIQQKVIGTAEIREVYRIPKVGAIAGTYVTTGKVSRNGFARLVRDSVQIWEGAIDSLRRFKEDVKEVAQGYECGISLKGFNDLKEGDIIEFYLEEEVETQLH